MKPGTSSRPAQSTTTVPGGSVAALVSPIVGADHTAVAHDERAVLVIDVRAVAGDRRIVGEVEDLTAVGRHAGRHAGARVPGDGRAAHRVFAPCATHAATSARSSTVICVRLPIGM